MMRRLRVAAASLAALTLLGAPSVAAGAGTPSPDPAIDITYVEPGTDEVRVLVTVPSGGEADPASVTVTFDGDPLAASASRVGDDAEIARTTVLAIDTSDSMAGARFAAAQQAATAFLSTVPDDVAVGIVSFAGEVSVLQEPTLDRDAAQAVVDGLTLSRGTRLHEGVLRAAEIAGVDGQRSVLVLSDGRDTSRTPLTEVTAAVTESGVIVDVIALEQRGRALEALRTLAAAGDGRLLEAATPEALTTFFAAVSRALADQLEITAALPPTGRLEGDLRVSIAVGGAVLEDAAFTRVRTTVPAPVSAPAEAPRAGAVPEPLLIGALVATGVALAFLIFTGLTRGAAAERRSDDVEDVISAYGAHGRAATGDGPYAAPGTPMTPAGVLAHAKDAAAQALAGNRSLEARVASRLETAGLGLKPAEWVLLHAGVAIAAALLGLLLGAGNPVLLVLGLVLGALGPWIYLGLRGSRRRKAFDAGLADTLQLMAGSLQAGLSLAQSVDTIVREGAEPIAGEFRRVLIEARLGVTLEDALDDVARRMASEDFRWVVMAIRIQREVGGNLAELLLTVAATLREREYLRRHVRALSAEGRLSAYVLGGLPPVFLLYLVLVRRDYVSPLFTDPRGWVMLGFATVLLGVGALWMSKAAKVEI